MKKITRLITILVLLFFAGCKGYSLDTVPYLINGTFVMEDNSQKEIEKISLVFYLFDKDGEPAYECRNKISAEVEKVLGAGEDCNFCISLDKYLNSIPEDSLQVDYLYISRIEYEDGSVWEDPFGMVAFK